ncbi:uroporphyrinogen-III C-methyltransferase [Ferruginibacter albus]|uniref:uroporphyrinogen-III C-methyltransferase n=1 Tax=Ferruginibacter albus TaxID=2875540 RepID=UPI001CC7D45A|nr:uroporphyrinogen-III C-methyltransferase [Ferruginibacter albus]UAY52983.1 uroporphyrinogen-III C-methyltransferase [Ferruginibacter albus]
MKTESKHIGKVILAAAGPGDPDLITVKVVRYLQKADVILTDRLVSEEILKRYANKSARIICVGKQYNAPESISQTDINAMLLQYAQEGNLVVRLKGGDVSIFSNILDELETLADNNIPYEVIPGVTAALGAAAYAGIPLTARGHSTSVRFLTYYKTDIVTDEYWKELANTKDTLVFYMSSSTLDKVVAKLIENNIAEDKLLAVIEQATTPLQNVRVVNLYEYAQQFENEKFVSPSLVIIGKVVALHERFAWLSNQQTKENYFKAVNGDTDAITKIIKEIEYAG